MFNTTDRSDNLKTDKFFLNKIKYVLNLLKIDKLLKMK